MKHLKIFTPLFIILFLVNYGFSSMPGAVRYPEHPLYYAVYDKDGNTMQRGIIDPLKSSVNFYIPGGASLELSEIHGNSHINSIELSTNAENNVYLTTQYYFYNSGHIALYSYAHIKKPLIFKAPGNGYLTLKIKNFSVKYTAEISIEF